MALAEHVAHDDDRRSDAAGNVVYEMLSDEEACLYAILTDPSGLELAEFTWTDERNPDGCWRAFPFQWHWWRDDSPQQVDQGARSIGKSESIMARVCVFPFVHPGGEMVITAPEAVHVDAITDRIEARLTGTRLLAEMLLGGRFGVNHRPFKAKFRNGALVHSRLPQKSGIGIKGTHPIWLEMDESQDYPPRGWKEIVETVNWSVPGAQWRCHGVSKGVRDEFYNMTQDDSDWTVHHYSAVHRPTWDAAEREAKIAQYGGSIHDPDFRRNVYGVHGDQANNIFILSRFMAGVDTDEASHYNAEEYFFRRITAEMVDDQVHGRASGTIEESSDEHVRALLQMLDFPELHRRYEVFWVGMDVGITRDPSEILVFAEYLPSTQERNEQRRAGLAVPLDGATRFKLITRLSLLRLPTPLQAEVIMHLIDFYRPRAFSMDRTGNGLPLFMDLQRRALESRLVVVDTDDVDEDLDEGTRAQMRAMRERHQAKAAGARTALTALKGYPFDASIVVEIDEERAGALPGTPSPQEVAEKAGIKRRVKDFATDALRDLVDRQRLLLPYDVELINQWNAQTWSYQASPVDAYGRRRMAFSSGTFHTLDAGRMGALGMYQQPIEALLAAPPPKRKPILPRFVR